MSTSKVIAEDCPIIALDRFIQATRDSGYKGTASAISELIDNSLQANADEISVVLREIDDEYGVEVLVIDNGCGMDPFTLRQALRFGGSSRFDDRAGLGRYGMGLPNSSLSQGRRVTVYTWQTLDTTSLPKGKSKQRQLVPETVYSSYLDVDEIASGHLSQVPVPHAVAKIPAECRGRAGTLIHWERCDRLDNRRISTLTKKLSLELGRRFRHFIWDGVKIEINGAKVPGIDPLFLAGERTGAELFGEELTYELAIDGSDPRNGTSVVRVRFSELPVHEWHGKSNDEKRDLGISKGAGVSIVRAGREVDYGWFFMGDKRKENYDDWWRCEVRFEPVLDEAFGITHTKQQVRPKSTLLEALTPDMEAQARALNSRIRKAQLERKAQERFAEVEKLAGERDKNLRPISRKPDASAKKVLTDLSKKHPALKEGKTTREGTGYAIIEAPVKDMSFYQPVYDGERVVLLVNPEHPFYKEIYGQLVDSEQPRERALRAKIELLLLAAARAEAAMEAARGREAVINFRREWSNTLATFLNG